MWGSHSGPPRGQPSLLKALERILEISRPPYYFLLEKLGKKLREGGIEE